MQPSIPWSSTVSVFFIERTAIIHSLKCTVPLSFAVPLLALAVTHCHSLPLVVTLCHLLHHSLSLIVLLVVTVYHLLHHSLSLIVIRCHSLSLEVPLFCLFINDRFAFKIIYSFFVIKERFLKICNFIEFTLRHVFSCKFAVYFRNTFL